MGIALLMEKKKQKYLFVFHAVIPSIDHYWNNTIAVENAFEVFFYGDNFS